MRWLLAPLLVLPWLTGAASAAPRAVAEIFYQPPNLSEWPALFTDDSQWPKTAKNVSVITLIGNWVLSATTADILRATNFVKSHAKKLNLDLQAIAKVPGQTCGGMEGYSFPGDMQRAALKLRSLGVQIDYLDMDEPLWGGYYAPAPKSCHLSIAELVGRTSKILNEVLSVYPNAQIIDIEPIPVVTDNVDWRQVLTGFLVGLGQRTGRPIHAVQADVDWNNPGWRGALTGLSTYLHQRNIGLGIFYVGTNQDLSDADWINHAVRNFEAAEGAEGLRPAQAVFASWHLFGQHNIPETLATTQTWLINRYVRERALLTVQFVGQGVRGRLTTEQGKPVPNATVQAFVPGVDFSQPLPVTVVRSVVPPNAVLANMGFRVNMECNCQGYNDVLLGTLKYQETTGGSAQRSWGYLTTPFLWQGVTIDGETVGGTRVTRVVSPPGTSFFANSPYFPVTPGASFAFTIPAATVGGAGWFGEVDIVWFDANRNAIGRLNMTPDPGHVAKASVTTDADGRFVVSNLPRVGPGSAPVSVHFDGGGTYGAATWTPLH